MFYQQGDVILEKVISAKGNRVQHDGILALGEATGHKHKINDLTGLEFYEKDGDLYLKAKNKFVVVHEEHNEITVDPGIYRKRIVREYDHFAEEARKVVD